MKSIILINAKEISSFFDTGDVNPAVSTICACLEDAGFSNIYVFPETEEDCDILNYEQKLEKFLKKYDAEVIGISCWTSGYGIALDMASLCRKMKPHAVFTAGGPHFSSAKEAEYALENNIFDIVFRGGATPFIDFCINYFSGSINVLKKNNTAQLSGKIPASGICYRDINNNIIINKHGSLDAAVKPVIEVNDDYAEIRLVVKDVCPNHCDYCVIHPAVTKKVYIKEQLEYCREYSDIIKKELNKKIRFALADSAPFALKNEIYNILDSFKSIDENCSFALFADPEDINDEMYNIIDKYNVSSLFLGRDRVYADELLGRRYKGTLRSQQMLDEEFNKLKNLIAFLEKMDKHFEIYLGYILSPVETAESSLMLMNEIKYFSLYESKNVAIQTNLFVLNPYPDTKVGERFEKEYIPMRYFHHPYPNVWQGSDKNHIQIELTRFILSKLLCRSEGRQLYAPMIDFIHKLQFENYADISLCETIKDNNLKSLCRYIMKKIAERNFIYSVESDKYNDDIIYFHLLSCMMLIMLTHKDWLEKQYFEQVMNKIAENDGVLPLLLKDLEVLKL